MSRFSDYRTLDALQVPLSGVNLIEANAGTGKTYNIVSLYLRLLLEASLTVDQILVVSFTEAATAELRERVRKRLRELQIVFTTGSGDGEALQLLEACPDRVAGLRQIVRALQSFDQAAIYTIHGFCQRLLTDAAFEAGLSQTTELITDDNAMRRQLIDDFWHTETAEGSGLWVKYLLDHARPDLLYEQLAKYFARPLMRRIESSDPGASADLEEAFANLSRQVQRDWPGVRDEIAALLHNYPGLKRNSYSASAVDKLIAAVDEWVAAGEGSFGLLTAVEKLGSKKIAAGTKKAFDPPQHAFFQRHQQLLDLGQQLEPILAQRLAAMRVRLLELADHELPRRKRERRVRHFDDLLGEVHAVLQSGRADALRLAVAQQYGAALIDEFQDTDPVQFSIFDSLFSKNEKPVFFVGDPKQAIYGFRGADVYAYLDARDHATCRYRLELNYRSTPRLVDSVNAIFRQTANPFVIDEIDFHPSAAARDKPGLIIDGTEQPAMRWWQVSAADGNQLPKREAEKQIAQSVATEIAKLLQLIREERVRKPGNEPLAAKDIAVLVSSHVQGRTIRDALEIRGVACMQRTEDNVFQTQEADELWYVLRAVVEPSRHPLVRAALSTGLLGYNAQQIDALEQDDRQWQNLLDRFAGYPETWRQHGFARMYRRLLRDFDVQRRQLGLLHGQRRVTNLLQLGDLLQRESGRRHGRLDEVLIWMREQKETSHPSDQAMLLRLDSDEDLVNIMTVHFSKGLQFPVVFCPYLWTVHKPRKTTLVEFHDDHNRPTLDMHTETDSAYRQQALEERLAERVRLAYVALTRGELACFAVWGAMRDTGQSSLNWLLQPASAATAGVEQLRSPTDAEITLRLGALRSDAMTAEPMPAATSRQVTARPTGAAQLRPRVMRRDVPPGWRVSSFSALTRHAVEEPRDYDAGKSADKPVTAEPEGIFAFPRGARAGRCMHALLEQIAFDGNNDEIAAVASRVLVDHGYDPGQSTVLAEMARNVLSTDLSSTESIRLRDVVPARRMVEMEFYFPTAGLDADALRTTLGEFANGTSIEHRLAQLEFRVGGGFMHGFIDLVFQANDRFYLVDYKSNWLGNERDDYRLDRLSQEIAAHDYYLQYLIYAVALHRHLARRLPDYDYDRHFGGAYYLFLRGMHPVNGPKYGVFHDRPDRGLMQRLESLFCNNGAVR